MMIDFLDALFGDAAGGGIVDGVADMLFGSMDGGGVLEWVLGDAGALGDMFGIEGAEIGEMLGGMGRAAKSESGFFRMFEFVNNRAFDYVIWKDILGNQGSFKDFKRAGFGKYSAEAIEAIREPIKAHGFMLQQLRFHKEKPGIIELLHEYEALGPELPSPELVKKSHRALALHLHPDSTSSVSDELMKRLNQSKEALNDPKQREAYESALRRSPEIVKKYFSEFGTTDWEAAFESVASKARLRLTGLPPQELQGASKWFSELSKFQQGGLVFAALAGAGAGTYLLAKACEKKPQRSKPRETTWREHTQQPSPHIEALAR